MSITEKVEKIRKKKTQQRGLQREYPLNQWRGCMEGEPLDPSGL